MKEIGAPKIVKEIKFERVWDELKAKNCFQRKSFTKFLRLTQVFMRNRALPEKFNFYVSKLLLVLRKLLFLAGRLGTRLLFYKVLRIS